MKSDVKRLMIVTFTALAILSLIQHYEGKMASKTNLKPSQVLLAGGEGGV